MAYPRLIQSNYLDNTRVLFDNLSVRPEIRAGVMEYGYNPSRIREGETIYTKADDLFGNYQSEMLKQDSLSIVVQERFDAVTREYGDYVFRLRPELIDDPVTRARLDLDGRRVKMKSGRIRQAAHFYQTVIDNPDILRLLQRFGVTMKKMQDALDRIENYKRLQSEFKRLKGECRHLRVERDKAITRLRQWIRAFIESCKVAFTENLQTLQVFGYFVRSRPKTRKKNQPETVQETTREAIHETTGQAAQEAARQNRETTEGDILNAPGVPAEKPAKAADTARTQKGTGTKGLITLNGGIHYSQWIQRFPVPDGSHTYFGFQTKPSYTSSGGTAQRYQSAYLFCTLPKVSAGMPYPYTAPFPVSPSFG